jgi:hypothetical protein
MLTVVGQVHPMLFATVLGSLLVLAILGLAADASTTTKVTTENYVAIRSFQYVSIGLFKLMLALVLLLMGIIASKMWGNGLVGVNK